MVSSPSPPAAPDPASTAQAQTGSNQQTALFQTGLNDVNQYTPLGNLTYNIDKGSTDADGNVLSLPSTSSTVSLNPQVQSVLDKTLSGSNQLADLGTGYMSNAQNTLNHPYDINANVGAAPQADAAYQKKIMDNMNALQQPYVDRSNEQLQANLANQGITQGSRAYSNAMLDQNTALNNMQQQNIQNATAQQQSQFDMANTGYQQNLSNYNTQYNQPLNEVNALRSASQVSQPQFQPAANTAVNPTNVAGIYNQAYQNQLGASNASQAQSNQMMSGLFGLGGALGSAAIMSDRRAKTNIVRIGETKHGIPVYRYKYIGEKDFRFGVMADEVQHIPGAVLTGADGYKRVNYGVIQ